jgi:hypothetical protein
LLIQGIRMIAAATMAAIFGTNVSVCSWICVTAWRRETTMPTTKPISSIGAETSSARINVWRISSVAESRVMLPHTLP